MLTREQKEAREKKLARKSYVRNGVIAIAVLAIAGGAFYALVMKPSEEASSASPPAASTNVH